MPTAKTPCVIWLGSVFDEAAMLGGRAISPAANRWQLGLLGALARHYPVGMIGYRPEPTWPKGRLLGRRGLQAPVAPEMVGQLVPYLNIRGLREFSLARTLGNQLAALAAREQEVAAVFSYNISRGATSAALAAQARYGWPYIPVIADVPEGPAERAQHDAWAAAAQARLYLSHALYSADQGVLRLHLDGGVTRLPPPEASVRRAPPAVLYTGALNRWAGIYLLLEAFAKVRSEGELWICGKGDQQVVERAAAADPRIKYFGPLSEADLRERCLQARGFVNPRPCDLPGNTSNFPSKVLEYLSYGKPIVSTYTPGLSPAYREVLGLVVDDTPEALALGMEELLAAPPTRWRAHRQLVRTFLATEKRWEVQAERLAQFVGQVAASRPS